jgi:hypothetical protein
VGWSRLEAGVIIRFAIIILPVVAVGTVLGVIVLLSVTEAVLGAQLRVARWAAQVLTNAGPLALATSRVAVAAHFVVR